METGFLTPEIAVKIIETYRWFEENPDKFSYQNLITKRDFDFYIKIIGSILNIQDQKELIVALEKIARGQTPVPKATIPVNIKNLVEEYEKLEKLKVEKDKGRATSAQVEQQSEKFADSVTLVRSSPKTANLVYQSTSPAKKTPEEPLKGENLKEWVERSRAEELVGTLILGGISQDEAKTLAPLIAERIKSAGVKIDKARLEDIIQNTFAQNRVDVSSEQKNAILNNLSDKLGVSALSHIFPSPSLKIAHPQPTEKETKQSSKNGYLYLLYKPQSYLQRFGGQFGFLFGGAQNNKQILEIALQRLIIENPDLYTNNSLEIRLLRAGIENLISAQEKISDAQFVPEGKLDDALKDYFWGINTQSLKLLLDQQEEKVTSKKVEIEHVGQNQENVKEMLITAGSPFAANVVTGASIKLKHLLANPNLGWFRTSLAAAFGVGSVILPIPIFLRLLMATGGLGLGVVQLGHSPRAIGASFDFLGKFGQMGSKSGTNNPFGKLTKNKSLILIIVAVVLIPVALLFFTFNQISTSQGVFLPQQATPFFVLPESKYIGVVKTADPSIVKGEPPAQIKYTILITAKEKNLINVQVKEQFSSFTKGNAAPPSPTLPTVPTTIEAGKTENVSFVVNLGKEFKDSVITNTVTVTADVLDGPKQESTTRSASVIIGNPPTSCFTFQGDWTDGDKGLIFESIGKISKSTVYATALCSGGQITIQRGGDKDYGGEVVNYGNTIIMYNRAFRNKPSLFYTFAHESGHVYGHRNGTAYQAFPESLAFPGSKDREEFIPTYTLKQTIDEDFAETIAVYIVRKEVPDLSGHYIKNMEDKWPKHYIFAKTYIFGGFDGF